MHRFLETQLLMRAIQIATKTVKKLKNKFALKGSQNLFFHHICSKITSMLLRNIKYSCNIFENKHPLISLLPRLKYNCCSRLDIDLNRLFNVFSQI